MSQKPKTQNEFDQYAADYSGSISHPLRALVEKSGENEFLRFKARWLARRWKSWGRERLRILDFGCGTGLLTKYLADLNPLLELAGTDPSPAMIEEARKRMPKARFEVLGDEAPFRGSTFDGIVISGVLHHVPREHWSSVWQKVSVLLAPGGRFVIFEHNPWHPLTQLVVRTTPIDHDAQLVSRAELLGAIQDSRLRADGSGYLHFAPPTWTFLESLESACGAWPLGTQFFVYGGNRTS